MFIEFLHALVIINGIKGTLHLLDAFSSSLACETNIQIFGN